MDHPRWAHAPVYAHCIETLCSCADVMELTTFTMVPAFSARRLAAVGVTLWLCTALPWMS